MPFGRVFCDVMTYVSCRGYDSILLSAQFYAANQGGTADKVYSSLTEMKVFVRDFCFVRFFWRCNYEILPES